MSPSPHGSLQYGLLLLLALLPCRAAAAEEPSRRDPRVFDSAPAEYEPRLPGVAAGDPLRRLTVTERVGVERTGELVRVPLFFHAGECPDPQGLELAAVDSPGEPIPYQADDIRRAADGGVARMHLYFPLNLGPWERKQFLLRPGKNPGAKLPPLPALEEAGKVTFTGDDLTLRFWLDATRGGAIAGLETPLGRIELPHQLLAPRLTLVRQNAELAVVRRTPVSYLQPEGMEIRELVYDAGPHFAKLRVRIGPPGVPDCAEYEYRLPRRGSYFRQTQRTFPEEPETREVVGAAENHLLGGRLLLGDEQARTATVSLPAGLRDRVSRVHGHANDALFNAPSQLALYPVPWVQTGMSGIAGGGPEGYYSFVGPKFERTGGANSDSIRSFWGEVCFLVCRAEGEEGVRAAGLAAFQPLVAVVDEPGGSPAVLHALFQPIQEAFGYTHARDWRQEVGRLHTLDRPEELLKRWEAGGRPGQDDEEALVAAAAAARAKLLEGREEQRVREYEKGRASGPLDPWHLTYASSPVVPLSAWVHPSEKVDRMCLATARAQRRVNGRVDPHGYPYVDCFATAFNMQVGSLLMGLHAGGRLNDPELARFSRDALRPPHILALYGHGQRTYEGLPGNTGPSDMLYASNSDFWLRITELACNEDLWIHRSVYGRYFDCIDVNADRMQRSPKEEGKRPPGWHRANFFRGQAHDHRWESWATAPFLGLLENAADAGSVGITEACYYARHQHGHWVNWPEITTFALTDLALREGLQRYQPPSPPPLPEQLETRASDEGNHLRWKPVERAAGYRVHRAPQAGGPWTWLNSPYTEPAGELLRGTAFHDREGKPGDRYFVTAVDRAGVESRWFPGEPLPAPGRGR